MGAITFNPETFRSSYPAFACGKDFPNSTLQSYWGMATAFINKCRFWCVPPDQQDYALNQMTAHIAQIAANAASGQITGILTGATIDKVSVTLQPPPEASQFQWWLNQTPYGQALLAFYQTQTVGGFYAGGSLDLSAFRRPARVWPV